MLPSEGHLQNRFQATWVDATCVDFHVYVPHCIRCQSSVLGYVIKRELKNSKTIFFRPLYPCYTRRCVDPKIKIGPLKFYHPFLLKNPIIAEPVFWHQKEDKAKTDQQKQ